MSILLAAALFACISLPPKLAYEPFASAPLLAFDASQSEPVRDPNSPNGNRWIFPSAKTFTIHAGSYYFVSAEVESGAPFLIFFATDQGLVERSLRANVGSNQKSLRAVIRNASNTGEASIEIRSLQPEQIPRLSGLKVCELDPTYYRVRDTLEICRGIVQTILFIFMGWITIALILSERGSGSFLQIPSLSEERKLYVLLVGAALLRMVNLGVLPPFVDEITDIAPPFSTNLRLQFGEGKFLGYWLIKPFANLGQLTLADPLWTVRLLIAMVGVLNVALIYRWVKQLAGSGAGLGAGVLWALCPFMVLHERLALFDAIVVTFLLLMLLSLSNKENNYPWSAGLALSAAMLTKITALFAIPWLLPLLWLSRNKPTKQDALQALHIPIYAGLLVGLLMLPWLGYFLEYSRNNAIHLPNSQTETSFFFANLFTRPVPNLERMGRFVHVYGGSVSFFLLALLVLQLLRKLSRRKLVLAACCLFSFLIHLVAFDTWYARYFLFHLLPFCALAGICLEEVWREWTVNGSSQNFLKMGRAFSGLTLVVVGYAAFQWLWWNVRLLASPYDLPVAHSDCAQYINPQGSSLALSTCRNILISDRIARPRPLTVFTNHSRLRSITEWNYRFGSDIQWEEILDVEPQPGLQFEPKELSARIDAIKDRDVIVAMIEPVDSKVLKTFLDLVPGLGTMADMSTTGNLSLMMWSRKTRSP